MTFGFTDRAGLDDRAPESFGPDAFVPVTVTLLLIDERREASILFGAVDEPARSVWLPRAQISVRPGGGGGIGYPPVEVTMPTWLARDRKLVAAPDPTQGRLF